MLGIDASHFRSVPGHRIGAVAAFVLPFFAPSLFLCSNVTVLPDPPPPRINSIKAVPPKQKTDIMDAAKSGSEVSHPLLLRIRTFCSL